MRGTESRRPSQHGAYLPRVVATSVVYIKLGQGGAWEDASLQNDRLDFGLPSDPVEEADNRDWGNVRQAYLDQGLKPAIATAYTNEIRTFFETGPETLWITFARGRLWWAFAGQRAERVGGDDLLNGVWSRKTKGGWRSKNLLGEPLTLDRLSTRLTKLAGYRRTICSVKDADYVLRIINAEPDPLTKSVNDARVQLERSLGEKIAQLRWDDFELLIELILTRSGWRRLSEIGGFQKDVDLVLEQPVTGERMLVQVKSQADQATLNEFADRLATHSSQNRIVFASHTHIKAKKPLHTPTSQVDLLDRSRIARLSVECGAIDWILDRT